MLRTMSLAGLGVLATLSGCAAVQAETRSERRIGHHHRVARHGSRHADPQRAYAQPYSGGVGANAASDCRTANGTPYDPDLTGGVNAVGEGGPGGFAGVPSDACASTILGGPGLFGPR